jgi:hypothetical protein
MPATLAAFSSAQRVTLAGSMMPACTRSTYCSLTTSKPQLGLVSWVVFDDNAALEACVRDELAWRLLQRTPQDLGADLQITLESESIHD